MERINALTQIMQILQRQLSGSETSKTRATKKTTSAETNTTGQSAISTTSIKQLETRIADRVKTINQDDDQWYNKAGRIFVDSVLAWEFGEDIVQDSRFTDMSQKILETLNTHQKTQAKLHSLLDKFK
jgi:hypothetical protein